MRGEDGFVDVGIIVRPHGIRGEVKVLPVAEGSEILWETDEFILVGESGRERAVHVEYRRRGSKHVLLKLAGVQTRNDAESLKGWMVKLPQNAVPSPPEGSYRVSEIVGLKAMTPGGDFLGTVVDVMSTAAQDIVVIEGKTGEVLIPAVEAFVKKIDVRGGKIVVDPIEGMLD